jgi:hypothetical protein
VIGLPAGPPPPPAAIATSESPRQILTATHTSFFTCVAASLVDLDHNFSIAAIDEDRREGELRLEDGGSFIIYNQRPDRDRCRARALMRSILGLRNIRSGPPAS